MPTGPELRQIKRLIEKRDRARAKERACSDELALEVWRVRQRGVSARNLAKALEVGASTVNDWTQAGKQLALERGELKEP
jgi:transposase